jgi:hypothetical protein
VDDNSLADEKLNAHVLDRDRLSTLGGFIEPRSWLGSSPDSQMPFVTLLAKHPLAQLAVQAAGSQANTIFAYLNR